MHEHARVQHASRIGKTRKQATGCRHLTLQNAVLHGRLVGMPGWCS